MVTAIVGDGTVPVYGTTPAFRRYSFTIDIAASRGFSAFDVEVIDDGNSTLETNGGDGFPFDDSVLPQVGLSCFGFENGREPINITAAVSPPVTGWFGVQGSQLRSLHSLGP